MFQLLTKFYVYYFRAHVTTWHSDTIADLRQEAYRFGLQNKQLAVK